MKLPKKWNDVNVYQFKELRNIGKTGYFTLQLETLAILLDIPSTDLEDYESNAINEMFLNVKWVLNEPQKTYKHELNINDDTYYLKPFKQLTLAEFIDLEYFVTNDYINYISHIASVFYKQIDKDKWKNVEFEPYIYSPFERFELFDDLKITDIYGIVPDYLKYRNEFLNKYENLFNSEDEDDEETININDFDTAEEYKDALKQNEFNKKSKKWGWESLLFELTDGDITKTEEVGNLSLIFVFNMLSMRKDMGYLETSKG